MPKRSELTISKRTVDGLAVEGKEAIFWDRELPGFGVRVYPSGRKIYVAQSRGPNGIRRVSLGRHGKLTAEQARKRAGAAIGRIKRGEDPVPGPPERAFTVADLAERYLEAHVAVHCNAHTQWIYRGSLRNHILPALGAMAVASVGRAEVAALHYGLRETPRGCEPGADGSVQDVCAGGGVGTGAAWGQPVPLRAALQGGPAGALSDGGRSIGGWGARCVRWRPRARCRRGLRRRYGC